MAKTGAFVRWLGVLPAAVVGVLLATLVANLLVTVLRAFAGPDSGEGGILKIIVALASGRALAAWVQNLLIPVGGVWLGSRMAPAFRKETSFVLAALLLIATGAGAFSQTLLIGRPGQLTLSDIVISLLFGLAGSVVAVRLILEKERTGWGHGWKSWIGDSKGFESGNSALR